MEIGIVGLPNVGKSSLFNALTSAGVASENFPFTTIEPNIGVVPVKDDRLDFLQNVFKAPKKVPAAVKFVDIAGLVPGASKGEGLGNKFLSHIREVDAIAQVVRCFDDKNVVNVLGDVDPRKDAEIISTELLLADLDQTEKIRDKFQGAARTGQKEALEKLILLEKIQMGLQKGKPVRQLDLPGDKIREFNFLTAKPVLYVANAGDQSQRYTDDIKKWAAESGAPLVELNAKVETEILSLPDDDRADFRSELGMTESGLDRLAKAGQKLLQLISFFAAGPKEAHAWHVREGSPIAKAAGKIHSDMEKGFIRAEVYSVDDLRAAKTEAALRSQGKIRMEGKDYITRDGDVVHIHFKV